MKILEKKWTNLMKKLSQSLFKLFILILLTLSNPAFSEIKFIKSVVENVIVTDGDSIKIGKEKIRLSGIDAPEIKQVCYHEDEKPYACGHLAKLKLEKIIKNSDIGYIYCFYSERDKYKRILADEVSAKEELAKALKLQKFIERKVEQVRLECENIKRRKEILKQGFKHLVTHTAFEHTKKLNENSTKRKTRGCRSRLTRNHFLGSTKKVNSIKRLPRSFLGSLIMIRTSLLPK